MSYNRSFGKSLPNWVGCVWEKYSNRIYKLCRSKCATKAEADDLFQEVALKFCQNANVLNNGTYLYPWLETVLLHCHYSEYRRRDGGRVIPVSTLCETSAAYDELNLKLESMREDKISEEALQNEFAILLNELSPLERMIVDLSVIGGFNVREISRLIGLSKSNIVCRRVEAFKKMREKMLGQQKCIKNLTGRTASLREIIECAS